MGKKSGTPKKPRTASPPDFREYWHLRMSGATARLRAAQAIVSHTGTRGALAENLLRELIREFLPQRWAVGTGFIMAADGGRTNQVDVLVYDQLANSPVYRDGDLVILSPNTVAVAIEVKSNLDAEQVPLAYSNLASVKRVDPAVLGLVFGYDGVSAATFCKHVKTWAKANPDRSAWPDNAYNLGQNFVVLPDPDAAATRGFSVQAGDDPIVRLFLTQTLTRLGLENLRPFMGADKTGDEIATF